MRLRVNVAVQVIGSASQVLNVAAGIIPAKDQFWIAGLLGVAQGLSAILSHFSNPDGTPASVAYRKEGAQ
jgi:hypothetical protein